MAVPQHHHVPPELLQRLVRSLAPDRVVLFGSRARSTARPGSDIDLLLIGDWSMAPPQLLRHAQRLMMHSFPHVDLVFCTHQEISDGQTGRAPFLRSILHSGVVIYEARGAAGRALGWASR